MEQSLTGMSIAILVTDNFEQIELTDPRKALEDVGAITKIISNKRGKVQGMNHDKKADQFDIDLTFDEARPEEFEGILLPGGVMNSDQIRINTAAQAFVKSFDTEGKPIAVICHGAWLLVSSDLVAGKKLTSWPTLQDDIRNAGGECINEEVVVDGNLVSSRKPGDIPAFNREMIAVFSQFYAAQGQRRRQGGLQQQRPAN